MQTIFSKENAVVSVEALLKRNDSCGVDGIFVSHFQEYWELNGEKILKDIAEGRYKPDAVQETAILKQNGQKRIISKYTCTDRVILDMLKRELTPLWENDFSEYSYAYQEAKSVQSAVKQAAKFIEEGKNWVVELDIKDFFDNICLQRLEAMLRRKIQKEELIQLIHKYLFIWVIEDFQKIRKVRGIIQGSPISPLFSNIYMLDLDAYLEKRYSFCRFSDNINIYCDTPEKAKEIYEDVQKRLQEKLGLECNIEKSGIYPALSRRFLGYEFYRTGDKKHIYTKRFKRENIKYYRNWHSSAIQKIDRDYHIVNDGILTKKDYTILFENDEKKAYLPVETCGAINIYAQVMFGSAFFEYANKNKLNINMFDRYGEYVGSFCTARHYEAGKTLLKQAMLYGDADKRLNTAKSIEIASIHNQRENLRYYHKHKKTEALKNAVDYVSGCMAEMKECADMQALMLIEARAKQKYMQMFDAMIDDEEFTFEKRTRRPPQNEVNALISFGNVFLYKRIATEIHKTALDIRIGVVHATNNRSETLNLDIAEIFKPIIVDRAIFTVIHNMEITKREHFQSGNGGVYLNRKGKRIFILALEKKLYQKITVKGKKMTYDALIREEIKKVVRLMQYGQKYKPFKYT